jgi:preprotein translocase subunit YajC
MEPLIVAAVSLILLWALFIYPQQRRVREHHQLVASLQEGDDVILSAGIFGRIVHLGDDELTLEVAPGVEVRVARQAVLRRADAAAPTAPTPPTTPNDAARAPGDPPPPDGPESRAQRPGAAGAKSDDPASFDLPAAEPPREQP